MTSITAGPDGNAWFTDGRVIGKETASGQIATFRVSRRYMRVPNTNSITEGPDGALWFTASDGYSVALTTVVGRISVTGAITQHLIDQPAPERRGRGR